MFFLTFSCLSLFYDQVFEVKRLHSCLGFLECFPICSTKEQIYRLCVVFPICKIKLHFFFFFPKNHCLCISYKTWAHNWYDRPCALADHGSEVQHVWSERESILYYGIAIESSVQFLRNNLSRTSAVLTFRIMRSVV